MGRAKRADEGGLVYHALNRANGRMALFEKDGDYEAFEQILEEAVGRSRTRLLAYCVMPNHWHLIVWPRQDGELSRFVGWLTLTHIQRWHAHRHTRGNGHVYQGRYKSFPVQGDEHFLTACRYVERNALRANLVTRAENLEGPGLDNVRLAGVSAAVLKPSTVTMMALAGVTLVRFRHRRSPVRSQ
jgi:putative transposase